MRVALATFGAPRRCDIFQCGQPRHLAYYTFLHTVYADSIPQSSITYSTALLASSMGDPASGGQPTPTAALLVVIPPVLVVTIAVLAIRCSEWWPRAKAKVRSWYQRSFLSRGRKRSGSDPLESCTNSEASIVQQSGTHVNLCA